MASSAPYYLQFSSLFVCHLVLYR